MRQMLFSLLTAPILFSACGIIQPIAFDNFQAKEKFTPDPSFGQTVYAPDNERKPLSAEEIFCKINVLHIEVVGKTAKEIYLGGDYSTIQLSGFIVKYAGKPHILTAGHLNDPEFKIHKIYVFFQDYKKGPEEAELLISDQFVDFALLKFKNSKFKYDGPIPPLGDSDSLREGEKIYALGSPLGSSFSIKEGNISNISQHKYIMHSAILNPGSSGGPLVNKFGEIVAVNVAGFRGRQANNPFVTTEPMAAPINDVKTVLRRVKKAGRVQHPKIPFKVVDTSGLNPIDFKRFDIKKPGIEGVMVAIEGGGLLKGDVILSCDGNSVYDDWQFIKMLKLKYDSGNRVELKIYRYGKILTKTIELE